MFSNCIARVKLYPSCKRSALGVWKWNSSSYYAGQVTIGGNMLILDTCCQRKALNWVTERHYLDFWIICLV